MGKFDIFRMDSSGALWLEAAANLETAKLRVHLLGRHLPGEYLIFDSHTGEKIRVTAGDSLLPAGVSVMDLGCALSRVVAHAVALVGADVGNLQLLDQRTNTLRIVAESGFSKRFLEFFGEVRCHQGCCGAALSRGQRVIVEDVSSDPIFRGTESGEMVRGEGVEAVQSIPLNTASGRLVGVLSTHFHTPKPPLEQLLRITESFATQVAELIQVKTYQSQSESKASFTA